MNTRATNKSNSAAWILRLGLAAVFLYAVVSSTQHPADWIGYFPTFMTNLVPALTLIKIFAVYQLALALWLLSGLYLRYVAWLCALTIAAIVLTNLSQLIITFRDIGLAAAAAALAQIAD